MPSPLRLFIVTLAILGLAAGAAAQNRQPIGNLKVVVVPARSTDSVDGKILYEAYCAACHNKDLKGYGPAGRFTQTQPIDLTVCAAEHKTQQSRALHIRALIDQAHGATASAELNAKALGMPDWAPIFRSMARGSGSADAALRMTNISNYIASLQRAKVPGTLLASK
jgi:hypothetical protein